jgi:hypothetical protein
MEGVLPESRHFTPIIRAEALGGAVENATALIHEMASSTLGKQLGPSVESFNALLEVRTFTDTYCMTKAPYPPHVAWRLRSSIMKRNHCSQGRTSNDRCTQARGCLERLPP